MKDKDLIKGLKNKKRSALEKVIETYSAYVNVVVYNTIGNAMSKEDMEEVISDVFISLWNNSEYIRDEGELRPYIGAVARNKSINKLRERKNSVELNEKTVSDRGDPETEAHDSSPTLGESVHVATDAAAVTEPGPDLNELPTRDPSAR